MPRLTGLVVGKDFRPPEGKQAINWCYLTVDLSDEERVSFRIQKEHVPRADIGDVVTFRRPRNSDRPSPIRRIASDPRLIPPIEGRIAG